MRPCVGAAHESAQYGIVEKKKKKKKRESGGLRRRETKERENEKE